MSCLEILKKPHQGFCEGESLWKPLMGVEIALTIGLQPCYDFAPFFPLLGPVPDAFAN